jgi:hypothetical protein
MKLTDVLDDPPKVHPSDGQLIAWGLQRPVLDFIDAYVTEGSKTLETGAGLSTILFALKGASHICITPFQEEVGRIRDYCAQRGISLQNVDFRVDLSTNVLPGLGAVELDLALIDGCHGFPTPFMDWYFTAAQLKLGGILIVDDVQIWTGRVLRDFLVSEPEWKLIQPTSDRTAIFLKQSKYHPWKDFYQQSYVLQEDRRLGHDGESKFRKGLRLLGEGKFMTLVQKMGRRSNGSSTGATVSENDDLAPASLATEESAGTAEAMPRLARRAAEKAVLTAAADALDKPTVVGRRPENK